MSQIGQIQILPVLKLASVGAYLDAGPELGEVLLPTREMPDNCNVGDEVEVFVSYDSEDRVIATTQMPYASVGEFALLQVAAVERVGAFLDWGLQKDLLLPFAEQTRKLNPGEDVVVFVYLDNTGRIAASMRLERHVQKDSSVFKAGDAVELLLIGKTDLGYKAIINGSHLGVLFKNEVFQKLDYGQFIPGFIKNVRDDGKIDLSLQNPAADKDRVKKQSQQIVESLTESIMRQLKENDGFLPIHDKTPAEEIYRLFGASKKKYKIALGGLYKKRLIQLEDDGIRLV